MASTPKAMAPKAMAADYLLIRSEFPEQGQHCGQRDQRDEEATADSDDKNKADAVEASMGGDHHAAEADHRRQRCQHNRVHRARRKPVVVRLRMEVVQNMNAVVDADPQNQRKKNQVRRVKADPQRCQNSVGKKSPQNGWHQSEDCENDAAKAQDERNRQHQ